MIPLFAETRMDLTVKKLWKKVRFLLQDESITSLVNWILTILPYVGRHPTLLTAQVIQPELEQEVQTMSG